MIDIIVKFKVSIWLFLYNYILYQISVRKNVKLVGWGGGIDIHDTLNMKMHWENTNNNTCLFHYKRHIHTV